jgi:hypothetical protein
MIKSGWRLINPVTVGLMLGVVVWSCGGVASTSSQVPATDQPSGASQPSVAPGPTAGDSPMNISPSPIVCPNPEGGACLGPIAAGTYTTVVFQPAITYKVPAGWSNFEDTPGNFLLVPPGYDLAGVNADSGDFVGVYGSIAAPNGCDPGTAPGVGSTPLDLKHWYERNRGITVTSKPTAIAGRAGYVLGIRMRPTWTKTCPYSNGHPVVPLIVGTGPSGLDHNIGDGRAVRLYLLANGDRTMVIEVVDIADARHLAAYGLIAEAMRWGP